jgi:hypothetical protein
MQPHGKCRSGVSSLRAMGSSGVPSERRFRSSLNVQRLSMVNGTNGEKLDGSVFSATRAAPSKRNIKISASIATLL